ncbi:MAG: methyltransferase domain-containing protein [Melioribacteraceae bacterium]|nr:methyltransferase domain-containing protein [Melioribacteraceae bacterium]
MKNKIGDKVNNHEYPWIFHTNPFFLRILHKLTDFITLRNWYVNKYLKKIVAETGKNFTLIDIGCGSGNIIVPNALKYKEASFVGIDKTNGNIEVLNSFREKYKLKNIKLFTEDILKTELTGNVDIITIITVLQLIDDDTSVIQRCYKMLKAKGQFLIYIPLKEKRFFRWYNKVFNNWLKDQKYENVHDTKNIYTPLNIAEKLNQAGFVIIRSELTYGNFGKIYYELYSFLLHLFKKNIFYTPVVALFIILLFPLFLILMSLDLAVRNKEGNGLIIRATKQ